MNRKASSYVAVGALLAAVLIVGQALVIVREGEAVVRTYFGRPDAVMTDPGLYRRWPWPVHRISRFDTRIQSLEGTLEQTLTRDGKNVIVLLYAGWRVADPGRFLDRIESPAQAERSLNNLLGNYKHAVLGRYPFSGLVNVRPDALLLDQIEREIHEAARPEAMERYGIDLAYVGIRKLTLPEAITEQVFERMRAERAEAAERYRSEGAAEALRIRAEADSQREQRLTEADAQARMIRAEGDALAAESYRVFEEDPELAMFLRKLDILEQVLGAKSTLVLSAETEPFDLLRTATPEKRNRPE